MIRKEIIKSWKELKNKLKNSWKEGKVLVFNDYTKPLEASEEIKNYARMIKNHQQWEIEFQRERTEFTKLESKLDKVRNLVYEGKFDKLFSLVKKGEI
jgi:glutamate mutase epsilon subunit